MAKVKVFFATESQTDKQTDRQTGQKLDAAEFHSGDKKNDTVQMLYDYNTVYKTNYTAASYDACRYRYM